MLPETFDSDANGREKIPMGFKLQPHTFVVIIPKTAPTKGSLTPEMLGPYQVITHDQVFKRVKLKDILNGEVKTWSDDSVVPFDDTLYDIDQLKKLCSVGKNDYIIEKIMSHYKGVTELGDEEYFFEVKWLTWTAPSIEPGLGLVHNETFKLYIQDFPEVAEFYSVATDTE
ncbi:hypothetical protein ADUPG1_011243 [Aduncisulcus paluster]|uniref:Uncharacterized protein n=1 Tax=Aduncisulcus paluster TaxID=2918883 RepID=A0ABQ5JVT8_9EUKA|nr:hypothetical protein ADUPG1_011243 [Aduncisulcus paluster]